MMILRLDELSHDAFSESEEVLKYFKDLKIMMEGILDLNRRGSLPELEKATTITLLLKITLRVEVFGDTNIFESKSISPTDLFFKLRIYIFILIF